MFFSQKTAFLRKKKIFFSMEIDDCDWFGCLGDLYDIDQSDIDNLLEKSLSTSTEDTGTIEAFCVWDGSVVLMSFPTSATGWERIDTSSVGKTSQIRWKYYDNSLQIVCKHRSCLGTPRPTNICDNCKMREKWRKGCKTPHEIFFMFMNDKLPMDFPLLINRKISIPEDTITKYLEILPSPVVKNISPNKCRKITTKTTQEILLDPSKSLQHLSPSRKIEESNDSAKYSDIHDIYCRLCEGIQNKRIQTTKDMTSLAHMLTIKFLKNPMQNSILIKTNAFDSFLSDVANYESYVYINTSFFTWLIQKIHNENNANIRIVFEKGDYVNDLLSTDMIPAKYNSCVKVLSKKLSTLCTNGENALISIICGECDSECLTIGPHRESTMPIGIIKII